MTKHWERPSSVPFPSVWHTFKAKDLETENLIEYRVQDMPEEYHKKALELMEFDFLRDEAMCSSTELVKDPVSRKEILELWAEILKQKLVLACFRENSDELVGLNMVCVHTKDEKDDLLEKITGEKWKIVYKGVKVVMEKVDVFQKYNVDKYLSALGLSVDAKYRGRGIATEILKARVPLCKAMGIPLTTTVFTGVASQKCATRAGFVEDADVEYEELCRLGLDFSRAKPKSLKLMSLKVN